MLKLFGGKPDHPMADPKEVRRILDDLPAQDAYKALDELTHWHESVAAAEGFRFDQRLALHLQIDEAAQVRVRKLSRDYLAAARPSRFQETRLWTVIHGYWNQAGLAYAKTVDGLLQSGKAAESVKSQVPLLFVRTLRSLAQCVKWMHLRYGPIDMATWGILNNVYALAEARRLTDAKVMAYPNGPESTPRDEFVRALLFSASSPDSLLPIEIEIAERAIADCAPRVNLSSAPGKEFSYWTDLAQAMAPLRLAKPPAPSPGLRFLATGPALETLSERERKLRSMPLGPAHAGAQGQEDPETALEVTQHLAMYWSPEPPERKSPRHAVKSRLTVIAGFEGVLHALDPNMSGSLNFDANSGESWIVENVSAGGFGAVVPQVKGDWLKVGTLLAMQPDGGTNWVVGAIRRVSRTSAQEARVGIETLSRAPKVVKFRVRGLGEEAGILLPAAVLGSGEVCVALRAGVYPPGQNLEATFDEREHVYMPQAAAQKAEDYELLRFREMIRDS
jgi:hypothetical protein